MSKGLLLALGCVGLNSAGQVLLKRFSCAIPSSFDWQFLTSGSIWYFFIPGLVCYAIGMFAWIATLRLMPLYLVYPVIGLSFITVPLLSYLYLNEPLYLRTLVGAVFIILGIVISVLGVQ